MPICQKLIDHDEVFYKLSRPPIILNDLLMDNENSRQEMLNKIWTQYSSDLVNALPSCQCGATKGEYLIGDLCQQCYTPVVPAFVENIEPIVWVRAPVGVNKLINPTIWILLKNRLKQNKRQNSSTKNNQGFNILKWICDPTYRTTFQKPKIIDTLIAANIERGYNNFVDNFDRYIDIFIDLKMFKLSKRKDDYLLRLIRENKESIFSQYMPLPNRSLLIVEKTTLGTYTEAKVVTAINSIKILAGVDSIESVFSIREKEIRTVNFIDEITNYYEEFHQKTISGKPGLFRKHIFGARSHFSFRTVAISITTPHTVDEIYAPWLVGLTAFRPHLIGKLLRLGYNHNEAVGYLSGHIEKYDLLLDTLLNDLINESRDKGLPVTLQRNPGLAQGSVLKLYISKFKTDPGDKTLSISILAIRSLNCDFDGDELNVELLLDNKMSDFWENFAIHRNALVLGKPFELSNNISIPSTVIDTMANWLSEKDDIEYDDEKLRKFELLPSI